MKTLLAICFIAATELAIAKPRINEESVTFERDYSSGLVTVSYTLVDEPAIITFDVQTNGVSVNGTQISRAWGGVNRLLKTGKHVFKWRSDENSLGKAFAAGEIKIKVNAWATNEPPAYLTVNLLNPTIRRFYDSAESIEGGVNQVKYKTEWLVFRRVPAKNVVWRMGNDPDTSASTKIEKFYYHNVMLTDDYYLSVFELTRAQFDFATGASHKLDYGTSMLPVYGLNYSTYQIRGNSKWPEVGHADVPQTSVIGKIRNRTQMKLIDVPTSAQWEYAARAGTGTGWFFGSTADELDKYAWYQVNSGDMVHNVGEKKPNPWGFYDIYGNVFEGVLDSGAAYYGLTSEIRNNATLIATNQIGPATCGTSGMQRGGHYKATNVEVCSSWKTDGFTYMNGNANSGIRLCSPTTVTFEPEEDDGVVLETAALDEMPSIKFGSVEFRPTSDGKSYKIAYDLVGTPAVITFDVLENGQSIGLEKLTNVEGKVNCLVQVGHGVFKWTPSSKMNLTTATAVVKAWPTNCPPDILVVDIESGKRSYYESEDALPGGVVGSNGDYLHDPYRTSKLVLKKMHAGGIEWRMGSFDGEDDRRSLTEPTRQVRLSRDFYIGIYEFTQKQYELLTGINPSSIVGREDSAVQPVTKVEIGALRGNLNWPGSTDVSNTSPLGILRRRTCGMSFDIPTSAQWEYACRGGQGTTFSCGGTSSPIGNYAWYSANSVNNVTGVVEPHPVGLKLPNSYGLYDMHGNVCEWALMWYGNGLHNNVNDLVVTEDPIDLTFESADPQAQSDRYRIERGGSFTAPASELRSARLGGARSGGVGNGFRVACPAVAY